MRSVENRETSVKRKAIPITLDADARQFYYTHVKTSDNYETVLQKLRNEYNRPEKQNRAREQWNKAKFSIEVSNNQDKSQQMVFRTMCTKLSQQLDIVYQHDKILRDKIIDAMDDPNVQIYLSEKVPDTAAHAKNPIATFLSPKKGSAGAFIVSNDSSAYCTPGTNYGGQARRNFKGSNKESRSVSKWLSGHKGCCCCGKDHRARDFH